MINKKNRLKNKTGSFYPFIIKNLIYILYYLYNYDSKINELLNQILYI